MFIRTSTSERYMADARRAVLNEMIREEEIGSKRFFLCQLVLLGSAQQPRV